jgi:TonB family protein
MVSMNAWFYVDSTTILLCISSRGQSIPSPTPARGTLEYAKNHALYAAKPRYPFEARARHWTGAGLYELLVRPNGTVSDVRVLKTTGHTVLDEEAKTALLKWRFYPGRFTRVTIPLTFAIGSKL